MTAPAESTVTLATDAGTMRVFVARPDAARAAPGVIMYMDAVGFREELRELARGGARRGYSCWLPDLYYRDGGPSFDPYRPQRDLEQFTPLMRKLTRDVVLADTGAVLDAMAADPLVAPGARGCVGFCMGGRLALWAAGAFPEQFAAAASLHGGQLGSAAPDSPHRYAAQMRCALYLGFASDDDLVPEEHIRTLEHALSAAGVAFESEIHPGTQHGYTFPQRFCFQAQAAERSWEKIFTLFARTLGPDTATPVP